VNVRHLSKHHTNGKKGKNERKKKKENTGWTGI